MKQRSAKTVFWDARCLQDPDYQFRGIGTHIASLLRARPNVRCVAVIDDGLQALPHCYRVLFDAVLNHRNPVLLPGSSLYVGSSPMTHSPRAGVRFTGNAPTRAAAVVYDFIPFDRPGYLTSPSLRATYMARLAHLKLYDRFLPISNYTAERLCALLGIGASQIRVTGAAVRQSLIDSPRSTAPAPSRSPYFLTVGGGDARKNVEVAIRATAQLNRDAKLIIVGSYTEAFRHQLMSLVHDAARFVEFRLDVADAELAGLYSGAVATIAPSYIEGFSLPVAEASACGSPVVASRIAAHSELLACDECLFAPDDDAALTEQMLRLLDEPERRQHLLASQDHVVASFTEDAVAKRFWSFLLEEDGAWAPAITAKRKPRVALITPYPPEETGVAIFGARMLEAAQDRMVVDLFTDAPRPLQLSEGVRDGGVIHYSLLRRGTYDAVVSVLGNSSFHHRILDFFEEFGGACILHDSRLVGIYVQRYGWERFPREAAAILGRSVTIPEVRDWMDDRDLPTLFLEPVIKRAGPIIVHTQPFRDEVLTRYGVEAEVAPFFPLVDFRQEELQEPAREKARQRLGIPADAFAICSFGYVHRTKGIFPMFSAVGELRRSGIPAELHLVGSTKLNRLDLAALAEAEGLSGHVHRHADFLPADAYRDYLVAADAALQLRTYGYGQASAGLADCCSAAVRTVATESLAEACDAPPYVWRVPDGCPSEVIAASLREIHAGSRERDPLFEQQQSYCGTHNPVRYVERIREILGFE